MRSDAGEGGRHDVLSGPFPQKWRCCPVFGFCCSQAEAISAPSGHSHRYLSRLAGDQLLRHYCSVRLTYLYSLSLLLYNPS